MERYECDQGYETEDDVDARARVFEGGPLCVLVEVAIAQPAVPSEAAATSALAAFSTARLFYDVCNAKTRCDPELEF